MTEHTKKVLSALRKQKARDTWGRGVIQYAIELLEDDETGIDWGTKETIKKSLLNGAGSWYEYSIGGCSLVLDEDVLERLYPPSQRTKHRSRPNGLLEDQARALNRACNLITGISNTIKRGL